MAENKTNNQLVNKEQYYSLLAKQTDIYTNMVAGTMEKIQIEYSYPNNQTLSQYPEVVLLNNGYSFLKVFKDEKGNYTLTKKDDLPIKVRLGLMPQDMLTPIGLKMPESLKLTLGDLLIPSKEEGTMTLSEEDKAKH